MAQARRILFKSGAQALVGNVDKRRKTLRFGPVPQRLPLRRGQVRAAGVVASAVEQHQVGPLPRLQVVSFDAADPERAMQIVRAHVPFSTTGRV